MLRQNESNERAKKQRLGKIHLVGHAHNRSKTAPGRFYILGRENKTIPQSLKRMLS
jgi:tRNA(Leu) C34 or U34 (ribose-2'-O)-methylase TrmL